MLKYSVIGAALVYAAYVVLLYRELKREFRYTLQKDHYEEKDLNPFWQIFRKRLFRETIQFTWIKLLTIYYQYDRSGSNSLRNLDEQLGLLDELGDHIEAELEKRKES